MTGYEFEYFSFFDIAVLFSAGNAKKNIFTVFIVPIVTIDGFSMLLAGFNNLSVTCRAGLVIGFNYLSGFSIKSVFCKGI